jgi:hypothetical protein
MFSVFFNNLLTLFILQFQKFVLPLLSVRQTKRSINQSNFHEYGTE